jgi:hypothetical protein
MEGPLETIKSVRRNQDGDILNVRTSGEREIGHQEAVYELKKGTISDPEGKVQESLE